MNNNVRKLQYFIFGHKSYNFIKQKPKIKSIEKKLDLVNWFIDVQEDVTLNQFADFNGHVPFSTNFELYLGRADLDVTRMYGYLDSKFLDEITSTYNIHNKERDLLMRHLIFYSYLKNKQINVQNIDLNLYIKHLDLVFNINILKNIDTSNKIYFLLNSKHLSNKIITQALIKTKNKTTKYFFHKSLQNHYQQIAEHIMLFDFQENETKLPLSGTIDRILQESNWRGRYKILPTIVKDLDNSEEYINRLGMNSYKANISSFDYKWWEFQHTLSTALIASSYNNVNLLNQTIQIAPQLNFNTLNVSFRYFNKVTVESYIDYNALLYLANYPLKLKTLQKSLLWRDFNVLYTSIVNHAKLQKSSLIAQIALNNFKKINYKNIIPFLRKPFVYSRINQLSLYRLPEHVMLQFLFSKFQNLFFLRASIGSNWGFLDVDLLQEEQEKREKDKYYKKYDDNRFFYYFLSNKDKIGYDDNTFVTDVKYKRFIDDVYKPTLTSPHKRPYNWLQIPEMSFSPFFLFLKNTSFMWFDLFSFKFDMSKKNAIDLFLHKRFLERFLYSDNFTYTYHLKQVFSLNFLSSIFLSPALLKIIFASNMNYSLKNSTASLVNRISPKTQNWDVVHINNLLENLNESLYLPLSFQKFYKIIEQSDIYSYSDFYLNNYIKNTAIKLEYRKSNQMRFNFMYKLGLTREHSWLFLYNSPIFFKQTIAYQAWVKERIPNIYAWEHDNPFLIQQIFRPYSLDLVNDITLYKYKADMLQLLLLGFKDIVFADTFLVENFYTKEHKVRSIFEIPKFTVPFFLFDSDLYTISQVPETILYEHISAFGIPALERQWEFRELTIDLTLKPQTSVWPNYLFNSEAYALVLWTARSTKNIFHMQEHETLREFQLKQITNSSLHTSILQKKFLNLSKFFMTEIYLYKIYSYFFKEILKTQDLVIFKNFLKTFKVSNTILYNNMFFFFKQISFLLNLHNYLCLFKNKHIFDYYFFFQKYYMYSFIFNSSAVYLSSDTSKTITSMDDFYVGYFLYLYIYFFILN